MKSWRQLILERDAIINATPKAPDVPGRSGKISDPTGQTVVRLEKVTKKLEAVDRAVKLIDAFYIRGIWNNCLFGTPYPDYASRNTWKEYKRDFYYIIAAELRLPLEEEEDGADEDVAGGLRPEAGSADD